MKNGMIKNLYKGGRNKWSKKIGLSMVLFIMATFIFTPKIFANEVDYTYIMEEVKK